MSRWIKLANEKGRWAQVRLESRVAPPPPVFLCPDGSCVEAATFIKGTEETSYAALRCRWNGDAALARKLVEGDPEIDLEASGRRAGSTDRVLLDGDGNALYAARFLEIVFAPDGAEIERREPVPMEANIDSDLPPARSGKMVSREDAIKRFAFTRNYRVRHVDGLTFDFLFDLAGALEKANAMAVVGSGPKGAGPLYLERKGLPYRGYLEGRTRGETYLLVLHLSNMELKRIEVAMDERAEK